MNNAMLDQPERSGESSALAWLRRNRGMADAHYGRNETIASRQKLAELDAEPFEDGYFFPFKIYRFPSCWRAAPDITVDWNKFRVHAGRWDGTIVAGTDGHDKDPAGGYKADFPHQDFPIAETDVADIAVPAGTQQYWFWIDATTESAPVLKSGYPGQAVAGNVGDPVGQGWATFPAPDPTHMPIGWVDTLTDQANKNPFIRQYVRSDAFKGGGGGSGGVSYSIPPYNPATVYAQFTIVRKQSGASQGVYIRVAAGSAAGIDPVYPEPTVGVVTWHCLALAIQVASICGGSGSQTIYVQASAPV